MTTATHAPEHKKELTKEEKETERLSKLTPEQLIEEEIKKEKEKASKGAETDKAIRESAVKNNEEILRASTEVKKDLDFNSPESVKTREDLARKQALPQQHPEISANVKPGIPNPGAERTGALSSANETPDSKLNRIALVLKNSGADSMGQVRGLQAIKEILGY